MADIKQAAKWVQGQGSFWFSIALNMLVAYRGKMVGRFQMHSRKRGTWVNFNDSARTDAPITRIHPGTISTCLVMFSEPVLTNGKIGSVSDTVTIGPQTSQDDHASYQG